jgi:hypothetical protein
MDEEKGEVDKNSNVEKFKVLKRERIYRSGMFGN